MEKQDQWKKKTSCWTFHCQSGLNNFQQVSVPEFEVPVFDVTLPRIFNVLDYVFIMLHVDLSGRDKMDIVFLYMKVVDLLGHPLCLKL